MSDSKRVAFITGANRGIGLQTARELGARGYTVVLGVRDPGAGEAAVVELRKANIDAQAIPYDATRPDTDEQVRSYFDKKYGRLDVLVNNAGITREQLFGKQNASTVPIDVVRETFETNVFAVIRLTQTLLPLIEAAPAGRIVNLSSILGSLGLHAAKDSPIGPAKAFAYNASKTALNAFTVHLANELAGTSVKVNSAHPGWVQTELGGPGAPMPLDQGAKTSVRLATLDASGPSGGFFHEADALPW